MQFSDLVYNRNKFDVRDGNRKNSSPHDASLKRKTVKNENILNCLYKYIN